MFNRPVDINRLFGTMDILKNRFDNFYRDFDWAFAPGLTWVTEDNNGNKVENTRKLTVAQPAVDIYENEEEFLLYADMPGVLKEDLSLSIDNGILSLSAVRKLQSLGTKRWQEFGDIEYKRNFSVPGSISVEKVAAELKDGVLKLQLPKSEAAKPRQIEINAA